MQLYILTYNTYHYMLITCIESFEQKVLNRIFYQLFFEMLKVPTNNALENKRRCISVQRFVVQTSTYWQFKLQII